MNDFENEDDKILIDKVLDKMNLAKTKNKITNTLFLNAREQRVIQKNIDLYGSYSYGIIMNSERNILVFVPDKMPTEARHKKMDELLSIIRITLPNENKGKYEHRTYLSALMKIGIERERIGDILVDENGADIIIFSQNKDYAIASLRELTRFKKAIIEEIEPKDVREKIVNFEYHEIIVSSRRIDNIVAELAKCSRSKALSIIEDGRVQINYEVELKPSRTILWGDIVTIRGKGKFIISDHRRNTKNGNMVLLVSKYS